MTTIHKYKPENLTKIIFALSNLQYDIRKLNYAILKVFCRHFDQGRKIWDGKDLAYIYFSLDSIGVQDPAILATFLEILQTNLASIQLPDIIKITNS